MQKLRTEKYKGFNINIFFDADAESPNEWGDNDLFLVHYHRDFEVTRDEIITEEDVRSLYQGGSIDQEKDYYIFQLSAYIHSGVVLSLSSSFACDSGGWDTSHVGVVLVSKKEFKTKDEALKSAEGLVETWNFLLMGDVYGYQVEIADDKLIEKCDRCNIAIEEDSCWGFYGDDFEKNGLLETAKDNIDYELKKLKEELKKYKEYKVEIEVGSIKMSIYAKCKNDVCKIASQELQKQHNVKLGSFKIIK